VADAMGLNVPSVYNAFGDKRALFVAALERYAATTLRERIGRLEQMPSARRAIEAFIGEIVSRSAGDPERRGCLLINTALDAAPHDAEIAAAVRVYFGEIEGFFKGRLRAAQAGGEIAASIDVRDTARLLLGVVVAVRVLSRTGASRASLESLARPALALLSVPTDTHTG
jgi:TetR/AcrR family transcriptional repressor of nem operon